MNISIIYLIDVLSSLEFVSGLVALVGGLISFIFFVFSPLIENESHWEIEEVLAIAKRFLKIAIVGGLLAVLIPNRATMAAMYLIPKIEQSEAIQKDLPEVYNLAMEYLERHLKGEE